MSLDPAVDLSKSTSADPQAAPARKMAELDRRLTALESGRPTFQVVTGTPTTTPRDGTPAVDTALKIWLRVGGTWRFVTLT